MAPVLGPPWADLVFHVLAHVAATARFPSSLHDPAYVDLCRRHLGPASARPLGEDAALLGRVLTSHELLARAQWTAFLFEDVREARRAAALDLGELDVRPGRPSPGEAFSGIQPVAESIRAAAELEAPHHARLPDLPFDAAALGNWLSRVQAAAPRLRTLDVACLRSLARRGRAVPPFVYVGVPCDELAVSAESAAMQAAHEATVVEVAEVATVLCARLGERDVEHAALVVLGERARRTGLGDAHGRWWRALGIPTETEVAGWLPEAARSLVPALL